MSDWEKAFEKLPLVAILRGIMPIEVPSVCEALIGEGFSIIEIPLNSPRAYESITTASEIFGEAVLIGAGTVLQESEVERLHACGARLIVAPNFNPRVAEAVRRRGLIYGPGVVTLSEAFLALESGAHFLKLFPAQMISPSAVRAMTTVLPRSIPLLPVGGINTDHFAEYLAAGARGFGLGSELYRPGMSPDCVKTRARLFREAYEALCR
jgi:2-dehydro-3-deoxyphosphogalactonate aldolase